MVWRTLFMRYTLDKEELEQLKTKILVDVSNFINEVVKFKEKTSVWPDSSGWPSTNPNNRAVIIDIQKFRELVQKLRDDVSETIRNL